MSKYVQFAVFKANETFLWGRQYSKLRNPKKASQVAHWRDKAHLKVIKELKKTGVPLEKLFLDAEGYQKYLEQANYGQFAYQNFGKFVGFPEKSIEHFVVAQLLGLQPTDVYVDVASCDSPVPEIYSRLYGCKTFRQDLDYPEGVNGAVIGGDASKMPVDDNFCDKMGLHCSLEHFEGNSDTMFIKEAERVLKPNGMVCIAPLYLYPEYAIQTNPVIAKQDANGFDSDAVLYCVKSWKNRHSRFYDVKHLMDRVINQTNLKPTLYVSQNQRELHPKCYLKFSLILQKT